MQDCIVEQNNPVALQYNPVITFIYWVALVYRHNRYARAQQHIQGKGAEQK